MTTQIERLIQEANADPRGMVLIFWAETDGIEGMKTVCRLMDELSNRCLLISGGDFGSWESHGNMPAVEMFTALQACYPVTGKDFVNIDGLSRHTGDQAYFLRVFLNANRARFNISRIAVVGPWYHTPRLISTLAYLAMTELIWHPVPYGDEKTAHIKKSLLYRSETPLTYAELAFGA